MKTVSSFITLAVLLLTIACAGGGATSNSTAVSGSPAAPADPAVQDRGQAELALDGGKVSVEYGRPTLRGRNIEALIQPGDEWRMDQTPRLRSRPTRH